MGKKRSNKEQTTTKNTHKKHTQFSLTNWHVGNVGQTNITTQHSETVILFYAKTDLLSYMLMNLNALILFYMT